MGLIVAPDPNVKKPPASWAKEVAEAINSLYGLRPVVLTGSVAIKATTKRTNALGSFFIGFKTVALPAGAFSGSPAIVLNANSGYPGNVVDCSVSGVSATGFTVNLARTDSTSTYVYWMAVTQTQEGT